MQTIIDYQIIDKLLEFERIDFGHQTCYDYVDSLVKDGDRYGVTIFVEPCGDISKFGNSWVEVLDWWIEVFRTQPQGWDYATSGGHLFKLSLNNNLPDNPHSVWPIEVKDEP